LQLTVVAKWGSLGHIPGHIPGGIPGVSPCCCTGAANIKTETEADEMAIPRLLVVDDDAETRSMLTQFLQQNGFIALPAQSEAEIRA
jgi:hypothetical protein